jgi:hypothetical protein
MNDKCAWSNKHWPEGCIAGIVCMTNLPGTNLHLPVGCMAGTAMHDKFAWSKFAFTRRVHGRDSHA